VFTTDALEALAANRLALVNSDDSYVVLEAPITLCVNFHPGDTLPVTIDEFFLSGTYEIQKITKTVKTASIQIGRKKKTTEDILVELAKRNNQF